MGDPEPVSYEPFANLRGAIDGARREPGAIRRPMDLRRVAALAHKDEAPRQVCQALTLVS